jgi:serine-type D-Ala-D-Ala carboxypeptidase (penicillin-binding protein 5/6)
VDECGVERVGSVRRAACFCLGLVALLSVASELAATASAVPNGSISASSFVAIDADSGRVLVGHASTVRRPIASLTKVMTALLVIERGHLQNRVRVTNAAIRVEPEREGLIPGQSYSRIALLWSSLLVSSNDSATALAIDAGGGSLGRFYTLMNAKARSLGMVRTSYASASGLNDTRNLSTALDQATLARAALTNPTFARIVGTRVHRTSWPAPTYAKVWVNHNKMLMTTPGTYGVKTGWTTRAGGCLIVAERRGGRAVIGVILDSPSIWVDGPNLIDDAFARMNGFHS